MKYLIYVFFIVLTTYSCVPNETCRRDYYFEFPAAIYPEMDTFNIGDTLWFKIQIDNQVQDLSTSEWVDISNLDIYFDIFLAKYDTIHYTNAISHFDYHLIEGRQNFCSNGKFVVFEEGESKKFEIGLIPKQSGGYRFMTPLGYDVIFAEDIELGDACDEKISNSTVVINNNDNNTEWLAGLYQIVEDNGDTSFFGNLEELKEKSKFAYVFYVR